MVLGTQDPCEAQVNPEVEIDMTMIQGEAQDSWR
jgi:hypothetical protein